MKKYRRIEVNAYHRRVTVVSGEWRPDELVDAQAGPIGNDVSLDDSDACEPVAPDSPEGQLILIEAVRTLEQRLTPETRATIRVAQETIASRGNTFFLKLQSLYRSIWPKAFPFVRKEK
jgi:hypothetical protein